MTFLPVPRQPALFKCWAVQPIELHTPILYIPLQTPRPLARASDPLPPPWLVTPPSRAQQPLGDEDVHGCCMHGE